MVGLWVKGPGEDVIPSRGDWPEKNEGESADTREVPRDIIIRDVSATGFSNFRNMSIPGNMSSFRTCAFLKIRPTPV